MKAEKVDARAILQLKATTSGRGDFCRYTEVSVTSAPKGMPGVMMESPDIAARMFEPEVIPAVARRRL